MNKEEMRTLLDNDLAERGVDTSIGSPAALLASHWASYFDQEKRQAVKDFAEKLKHVIDLKSYTSLNSERTLILYSLKESVDHLMKEEAK